MSFPQNLVFTTNKIKIPTGILAQFNMQIHQRLLKLFLIFCCSHMQNWKYDNMFLYDTCVLYYGMPMCWCSMHSHFCIKRHYQSEACTPNIINMYVCTSKWNKENNKLIYRIFYCIRNSLFIIKSHIWKLRGL